MCFCPIAHFKQFKSTSNSCAIIRVYYSTLDGCAMAYDGFFYWNGWAEYLNAGGDEALADFHETGNMVMKTKLNDGLRKQLAHLDALGIPYEHWTVEQVVERFPFYDLTSYAPAKRLRDPDFGEPTGSTVDGAVFFPNGGYISDPQLATQNIAHAAQRSGAEFPFNRRVVEIPTRGERVQGIVLDDGRRIDAPVVVNVAGPHSCKVNALAGVDRDMNITTRALRQEVAHVPAPPGVDYAGLACVTSDSDAAIYTRPEIGNNLGAGIARYRLGPTRHAAPPPGSAGVPPASGPQARNCSSGRDARAPGEGRVQHLAQGRREHVSHAKSDYSSPIRPAGPGDIHPLMVSLSGPSA